MVVGECEVSDVGDAARGGLLQLPVVVPDHVDEPLFGVVLVHHDTVLGLLVDNIKIKGTKSSKRCVAQHFYSASFRKKEGGGQNVNRRMARYKGGALF